jgi:P pilus assembly chaperone PapD
LAKGWLAPTVCRLIKKQPAGGAERTWAIKILPLKKEAPYEVKAKRCPPKAKDSKPSNRLKMAGLSTLMN